MKLSFPNIKIINFNHHQNRHDTTQTHKEQPTFNLFYLQAPIPRLKVKSEILSYLINIDPSYHEPYQIEKDEENFYSAESAALIYC